MRAEREAFNRKLHDATQRLAPIQKRLDVVRARLALEEKPEAGEDPLKAIRDALKAIDKAHTEVQNKIWGEDKKVQGINRSNDGMMSKAMARMSISSSSDAPNKTERDGMLMAAEKVAAIEQTVAAFCEGPLQTFQKAVAESGLALLPTTTATPVETAGDKK